MISQVLAIAATLSVLALKEEYIPASLNLNWGLSARQGMRPSMEDTHVARMNFNRPGDAFFGLYDGHGGPQAAITAAYGKGIIKSLHEHIKLPYNNNLKEIYHQAYQALEKDITHDYSHASGTCAVTAHIINQKEYDPELHITWLGDSRAVLVNHNGSVCAEGTTQDHKPDDFFEHLRILAAGGYVTIEKNDCPRVGGLAISRALGDAYCKAVAKGISAKPDIISLPLSNKHKALIIACDGVWDVLSNQEAALIVHQALQGNLPPKPDIAEEYEDEDDYYDFNTNEEFIEDGSTDRVTLAARALRTAAYLNMSGDNISVIVIELQ